VLVVFVALPVATLAETLLYEKAIAEVSFAACSYRNFAAKLMIFCEMRKLFAVKLPLQNFFRTFAQQIIHQEYVWNWNFRNTAHRLGGAAVLWWKEDSRADERLGKGCEELQGWHERRQS
jgi:hypothetical protein